MKREYSYQCLENLDEVKEHLQKGYFAKQLEVWGAVVKGNAEISNFRGGAAVMTSFEV